MEQRTKSVEIPLYNCTYCGYEALVMNQIKGQDGTIRLVCGECMIKAFDKGLGYTAPAPEPAEPIAKT